MERKRSSQSSAAPANEHPPRLLSADGDSDTVNIGIGIHTQDSEAKETTVAVTSGEKTAAFSFGKLPSEKKWVMATIAFANFAACTCFSLLAPFFPAEASKKGASQTMIGVIFSCFELLIFLSAPVYGNYLTRIGSRFVFISGLFVCGGCSILFGVLDQSPPGTIFIVMCFSVRSIEALGAAAFITASFAIIANEFPNHVSTVFGVLETFSAMGLMVGPPIGGALFELGGFGLPFWVMGGCLIGCAVLTILILPAKPDVPRPDRGSILVLLANPLVLVTTMTIVCGSFSLGFLDPTLASHLDQGCLRFILTGLPRPHTSTRLVTTVIIVCGSFSLGFLDPILASHLDQFHLKTVLVGLVFIVAPALYGVTAPLWGYLSDTKGISSPIIVVSNFGSAVVFLLMGPSPLLPFLQPSLWLVILSLALLGLTVGCALVSTLKCLLNGAIQSGLEDNLDTYALVSGLFNSAFSLGTFLGPTIGSIVVDRSGFSWAATVTAGVFAFAGVVFLMYIIVTKTCCAPRRPPQQPPATAGGHGESEEDPRQPVMGQSSPVSYNSLGSTTPIVSANTDIRITQNR